MGNAVAVSRAGDLRTPRRSAERQECRPNPGLPCTHLNTSIYVSLHRLSKYIHFTPAINDNENCFCLIGFTTWLNIRNIFCRACRHIS
uniref:Uncharacterized protein n=1 Tax=Serratia marcescens TaxID=615 RepID=A0A345IPJ5_SERMA|nr:hypothetical protein [Serratia marcescens]AXH02398.1 hypothetical protein [Serratia marcescens]AXH02663.1 hypothetical protein [Serratia marcescens]